MRPAIFAKIVSSLPMPAFSPGRKRRPRWRMMIVPPVTTLPSWAFTPSRCELESRRLRERHARRRRAMALGPAHAFAALFLEDADFRAARFAFDHGHDTGLGDKGRAGEDFAAVFFAEQDGLDRQRRARLAGRAVDGGEAPGGAPHLTPARLDDCVHSRHLCKGESVHPKSLSCKGLGAGG